MQQLNQHKKLMNTEIASPEGESKPTKTESTGLITWIKNLMKANCEQSLKSELEEIIQEHEDEGNIHPTENTILKNVLKFGDIRVTDVMTPRPDVNAVPSDISLIELRRFVADKEHTRIPVFRRNLDDIVGFIHIKDLLQYWGTEREFKIEEIIRELLFVPPSMRILNLLAKMQNERTHMAIVVDEYGGTDGLVTIEDLVEEIVGEIDDEHDDDGEKDLIKASENNYDASARLEIKKLETELSVSIYENAEEEQNFDTIGGLIFTELGRIPRIGESVTHKSGLTFKVIDADKRRIKRVKIVKAA